MAPGIHLSYLFFVLVVLVFSLSVHEAAHAWTASRLGDHTARDLGRVSLNPLVHIDPIGTIVLPVLAFLSGVPILGWAKPVPVRTRGLLHPRRDLMLIAAAGPASNVALALIAAAVLQAIPNADRASVDAFGGFDLASPIGLLLQQAAMINLLLAIFNMIPIPPLDGGNVLANLLPTAAAFRFEQLRPYGVFVLYGLLFTGLLSKLIMPPYIFLLGLLKL